VRAAPRTGVDARWCSESAPRWYTLAGLPAVPIEVELLSYISSKVVVIRTTVATP
jgi:hypothetical protein